VTNILTYLTLIINFNFLFDLNIEYLYQSYYLEWIVLLSSFILYKYLGVKGFWLINILTSLIFLFVILLKFNYFVYFNNTSNLILPVWGKFNELVDITFNIYIDYISYNFSMLTVLISVAAYAYSIVYMRFEKNIIYFIFLLKLFVLSMVTLVWAGNWITFVLGWEMIGISSFLLINFWVNKITTLKSAFKAFTFNKFSDICLILCLLILINIGGFYFTTNYLHLNLLAYNQIIFFSINFNLIDFILFILILGSFCKSAQFGFHFWLPDSMEAPVPASALIHSATLVSAGIYLLLRYNILLQYSSFNWYFILILSSFTSFYGAIIAGFQTDGKKILAYSTISHCGFLMVSLLLFNPLITLLYLIGHGLFKSASFMCVGNLIQANNNYQDSRVWGNQSNYHLFEFYTLLFCILNLSGFPFTINFFTKHFLFFSYNYSSFYTIIGYIFLKFAAYSGIFYSFKIILNSFFSIKKNFFKNYLNINWSFSDIIVFKNFFKTNKIFVLFLVNLIILGTLISYIYISIYFNINYIFIDSYTNFNVFYKNFYTNILINFFFIILFFEILKNLNFFKIKQHNNTSIYYFIYTYTLYLI